MFVSAEFAGGTSERISFAILASGLSSELVVVDPTGPTAPIETYEALAPYTTMGIPVVSPTGSVTIPESSAFALAALVLPLLIDRIPTLVEFWTPPPDALDPALAEMCLRYPRCWNRGCVTVVEEYRWYGVEELRSILLANETASAECAVNILSQEKEAVRVGKRSYLCVCKAFTIAAREGTPNLAKIRRR